MKISNGTTQSILNRIKKREPLRPSQYSVAVAGMLMLMIAVYHSVLPLDQHHEPINLLKTDAEITGQVVMAETMTNARQRIRFRPVNPKDLWQGRADDDLRLITYKDAPHLRPGNVITVKAKLSPHLPKLLPGSFDFTAHNHNLGFAASGFVNDIKLVGHDQASFVAKVRFGIQEKFNHHLTAKQMAVASAVIIGLRAGIDAKLRETFRASGLAHLLAISGLHMALFWGSLVTVFRAIMALFQHFSSQYPSLKIATLMAFPFGLFYLVISGAPISALRAFLMLALVMLAILLTRRGMTLHHVALVAISILLISPASLIHPAFQMSFAAVFVLVGSWMMLMRYRHFVAFIPKPLRYILGIMMTSILASLASAPFVIHHFGVTTLWSVVANVLGIPLMGLLIIPFGALALFLTPFGLESFPLAVMGVGLDLLTALAEWVSTKPYSKIAIPPPSPFVLVLITAAMMLPVILNKWWKLFASVPLLIGGFIWVNTALPIAAFTQIHGRFFAGFNHEDGAAYLSHEKMNAFAKGILLKPFGQASANIISCPECSFGYQRITLIDGRIAAFVYHRRGLTNACKSSDLVLTVAVPKYPCLAETVITSDDIKTHGGVLIYGGDTPRLVFAYEDNPY